MTFRNAARRLDRTGRCRTTNRVEPLCPLCPLCGSSSWVPQAAVRRRRSAPADCEDLRACSGQVDDRRLDRDARSGSFEQQRTRRARRPAQRIDHRPHRRVRHVERVHAQQSVAWLHAFDHGLAVARHHASNTVKDPSVPAEASAPRCRGRGAGGPGPAATRSSGPGSRSPGGIAR